MASLVADQFGDWRWRLNNLYAVMDKEGHKSTFSMNWAQEELFDHMHFMNVILKARQLGFTTFVQLFMLDQVLFNSDMRAGTIAHTLGDAQVIFRDKVKFPYDQLPDGLKERRSIISSNKTEMMLSNNSSIRVGTSLRSGTLQLLHISEYGKICSKYPEKAREVRTGALNTVQAGQVVFIESTAEGQEGHFFDICQQAEARKRMSTELSPLDFKFHFYPWHRSPDYSIEPRGVVVSDDLKRYFDKLEATAGVALSDGQKAWYAKKCETQLSDMKREYPGTPGEAFEASIEGAYYADPMAAAELQGRVGDWSAVDGFPVHTSWDIGHHDYTAIWFFQVIAGKLRIVGYFQNTGEGMPYYVGVLRDMAKKRGWTYGWHFFPHDAKVTEWGSARTRIEQIRDLKLDARLQLVASLDDGINAVRATLPLCTFDAGPCAEGIKLLKSYRKTWDEERGIWLDRPRHDASSHSADAFRGLALSWREAKDAPPANAPAKLLGVGKVNQVTMNDMLKASGVRL